MIPYGKCPIFIIIKMPLDISMQKSLYYTLDHNADIFLKLSEKYPRDKYNAQI